MYSQDSLPEKWHVCSGRSARTVVETVDVPALTVVGTVAVPAQTVMETVAVTAQTVMETVAVTAQTVASNRPEQSRPCHGRIVLQFEALDPNIFKVSWETSQNKFSTMFMKVCQLLMI